MKVYMVVGNNCEEYECYREWNEAVFASQESAENYIQKQPERYAKDDARIYELEELKYDIRELTEDEEKELSDLKDRWVKAWRCCPDYRIEEYEVQE